MAGILPEYYAITAPLEADGSSSSILDQAPCLDWLQRFERLLKGRIELVQLRAKTLAPDQLEALARHCQGLANARGVRLLLNGPAELARDLGMAGVHLTSKALMESADRPIPGRYLVGASCHSAEELAKAERIGADFACLSPVRAVKGYQEEQVLGFDGFAALVRRCAIPVYALGGMKRDDLDAVRNAGGQGVAGISAFWR